MKYTLIQIYIYILPEANILPVLHAYSLVLLAKVNYLEDINGRHRRYVFSLFCTTAIWASRAESASIPKGVCMH